MDKFLRKYFSGLTKNSVFLAFASLFSDISTEMLYPIIPIYLTQYLKASGSIVGIIEGIAQAAQYTIQGFSGWLSDKLQKRKSIALVGYIISAISKPFIGIAHMWTGSFIARVADRLGAGSRAAPRDAMVAESVEPQYRGKAFGLEGFGDNLGAFLGPLLTILLFFSLKLDIHYIFYLAIIPGLLSVLMIFLVKEKTNNKINSEISLHLRNFPKPYWKYLLVTGLFGIGNSTNAFLILRVREKGLSLIDTILVYAFYNLVAAIISYPAGLLSDKFGRKPLLLVSFIIFFISYTGFAFVSNIFLISVLFIFYGLFQGIYRATGKSFASDFVPQHLRASSIGWYSTVVGLSGLVASIIAGYLWDKVSHTAAFVYGSVFSFIGIVFLMILISNKRSADN